MVESDLLDYFAVLRIRIRVGLRCIGYVCCELPFCDFGIEQASLLEGH